MAYLERIRIDAFGRFADKTVGPFSPGLNVVFGRNEAGKSTMSAFVDGVLFGWPEARGGRNTQSSDQRDCPHTAYVCAQEPNNPSQLHAARLHRPALCGDPSIIPNAAFPQRRVPSGRKPVRRLRA